MTSSARNEGDVHGFVRDACDQVRREITAEFKQEIDRLHARIGNRRDDLERFRRDEFGTMGLQVAALAHDLARGSAPGWIALRFDAIEASIDAAKQQAVEGVATLRSTVEARIDVLEVALKAQAATLTWYQRTLIGAMVVFATSLAVQVVLARGGAP